MITRAQLKEMQRGLMDTHVGPVQLHDWCIKLVAELYRVRRWSKKKTNHG